MFLQTGFYQIQPSHIKMGGKNRRIIEFEVFVEMD